MVTGEASYVIPRFKNHPYLPINQGEHFGHVDLFGPRKLDESLI
jgi:hypothetical protein